MNLSLLTPFFFIAFPLPLSPLPLSRIFLEGWRHFEGGLQRSLPILLVWWLCYSVSLWFWDQRGWTHWEESWGRWRYLLSTSQILSCICSCGSSESFSFRHFRIEDSFLGVMEKEFPIWNDIFFFPDRESFRELCEERDLKHEPYGG